MNYSGGDRCSLVEQRYNSTWIDPRTRPNVTIALTVIYVVSLVVVVVSAVVMRWKWAKYERLRARGFVFFFATTLGVLIFLQSGPLQEILGKAAIPCVWNLISSNMVVPLLGGALVGRLLDSMNKTNLARAIITVPLAQADFVRGGKHPAGWFGCPCFVSAEEAMIRKRRSTSTAFEGNPVELPSTPSSRQKAVAERIKRVLPRHVSSAESIQEPGQTSSKEIAAGGIAAKVHDREFYFWRRLASKPGRIFLMSLILAPFIVASIGLILAEPYFYWEGCSGCAFSNAGLFVLVFTSVGVFIFAALASWRIRRFPDPFGIVRECRLSFLFGGLPAIIFFVLDKWEPRLRGHPDFSWIIPEVLAVLFMFIVHGPLQLYYAATGPNIEPPSARGQASDGGAGISDDHEQSPPNPSSSLVQSPELEDVLDDPDAKHAFEEFLISIWAAESLRFYVEAVAWGEDFHTMGPRTALSRAKRIVRVFVDLSGSMTVNLRADVVNDLQRVFIDGFIIRDTFFDTAVEEILRLMRSDSFFRFRQTTAFANFADEWRQKLESDTLLYDSTKGTGPRPASLRYSKRLSAECIIMNLNELVTRSRSTSGAPSRADQSPSTLNNNNSSNEDVDDGVEAVALV